jgi:hypothetical protein
MDHLAAVLSHWPVPSVILPGKVSLCYRRRMIEDDIPLARAIGQSVGKPGAKVLGWTRSTFGDGFADAVAGGAGLILHTGTAMTSDGEQQYQIVEKICRVLPSGLEPKSWLYWKREALAYESGFLEDIAVGLRPPKCFGVAFTNEPSARLFIEAVSDPQPVWTADTYGRAAEALGIFNAHSAGMPDIERHPWMAVGRAHSWTAIAADLLRDPEGLKNDRVASRWLAGSNLERTFDLWRNLGVLQRALADLPKCFCHHDAFKRNLLFHQVNDVAPEIVAIDWAFAGHGVIGEEIAAMIGASLMFFEIQPNAANDTIEVVFQGYLRGLEMNGWTGSPTDVRLGFCATTAMMFAVGALGPWLPLLQDAGLSPVVTSITGTEVDPFIDNLSEIHPHFLDLGEEAMELAGA